MNRELARAYLCRSLNQISVDFHPGQWEAIDAIVNKKRKLLMVQRTGWGKSYVYFISAKLLREKGSGPVIIISPLLALMRNQLDVAKRLELEAFTINSSNEEQWENVRFKLKKDKVDVLIISPERLANQDFIDNYLLPIAEKISLLVVDEAHCISDWGHDFRPDYKRIVNILKFLPINTPILCTTATANDRVINDIKSQLSDIEIIRGQLHRKSLSLDTITLPSQEERFVWIKNALFKIPGTGIIYTLTIRDSLCLTNWLKLNGINAEAYYSGIKKEGWEDSDTYREYLERLLLENKIKVLVATTALGMGFDKPDLSFVIHYQMPNSIISYYQQVGRAGRALKNAFGILLCGKEDKDIHQYFRNSAFPEEKEINVILSALDKYDGLSIRQIEEFTNISNTRIEKALKVLSVMSDAPVIKQGGKWTRTPRPYSHNQQHIDAVTSQRVTEYKEMLEYTSTSECKMSFLRLALDDNDVVNCGKCSSCLHNHLINISLSSEELHQASLFLRQSEIEIEPKKQFPNNAFKEYQFRGTIPPNLRLEVGRILANWGDAGWGQKIASQKHSGYFENELVDAMCEMIEERWSPNPQPKWICCIPSLSHPNLVPDFSYRLAKRLGIPFYDIIKKKKANEPQKLQYNRYHQCKNLDGVFEIEGQIPSEPVLLVDDIIDSGWTFTVAGILLKQAGCSRVYPVALASSKGRE